VSFALGREAAGAQGQPQPRSLQGIEGADIGRFRVQFTFGRGPSLLSSDAGYDAFQTAH